MYAELRTMLRDIFHANDSIISELVPQVGVIDIVEDGSETDKRPVLVNAPNKNI